MIRRISNRIQIGSVAIGGDHPVVIQSMCNTPTADTKQTLEQIRRLAALGCEIIRVAVPDMEAATALGEIVKASPIPVVADIHFDHRLALEAIRQGIHAIRINPGNLADRDAVRQVAEAAHGAQIPIRVGANSGSLPREYQEKLHLLPPGEEHDEVLAEALVASALSQAHLLEEFGLSDIKISLKASSVPVTVAAYRNFARITSYPLHVGVTETGTPATGIVKSAVGIGTLLMAGIGDTIRVSLTAPPESEVLAAKRILCSVGLRQSAPDLVACPTCGRTRIDLIGLAEKVEMLLEELKSSGKTIALNKIAVMGCIVNGPGEARDADLGIAGGNGKVAIFRHGEVIASCPESEGFERLRQEILQHVSR